MRCLTTIHPARLMIFVASATLFFSASPVVAIQNQASEKRLVVQSTRSPVIELRAFLDHPKSDRAELATQSFAQVPLTKKQAAVAKELLWNDYVKRERDERAAELKSSEVKIGDLRMPFVYQIFGRKPASGRSLYISMHGGGGAPKPVNDQQWENQKRLYRLNEGVYLVPRAPTDSWNLWHQAHVDQFFARLIEDMILLEDVDPNRVYIMGYSAGGDGVYQLAPRMADQLAAASMMAGHPNETSPLGLRNLPFTIHMGALDSGYDRNKKAKEWEAKLSDLHRQDPDGYIHQVTLHQGKGHWMDRQDAVALDWMAKYTRQAFPKRIVWKQDDVVHPRFYWLAVDPQQISARAEVRANLEGQQVTLTTTDAKQITVRFNDSMVNLDQPVVVKSGDRELFRGRIPRTIATLAKTLSERRDPTSLFSGEVTLDLE